MLFLLAKSLGSVDTVYSADSIEFAPFRRDVFVCGTYQIEKLEEKRPDDINETEAENQSSSPEIKRSGRALVYQVRDEGQSLCVIASRGLEPRALSLTMMLPATRSNDLKVQLYLI
jgi:hypothetical protein